MVPARHGPQVRSAPAPPGSTNWIEQPEALVELLPPDGDHVSVPTDARALMNAARASLFATSVRSRCGAP
jgi:hypothetical protein